MAGTGITKIADTEGLPFSASVSAGKRALDVKLAGPLSSFGSVLTTGLLAKAQIDPLYGLRTKTDVEVFNDTATGSVSVADQAPGREFRISTGADAAGYGILRSKRAARYRPGQGIVGRITARFDNALANSSMRIGLMNFGNELTFGYSGVDFGIFHIKGGRPEIQDLSLTASAVGSQTITIVLNDVSFDVSITAGTVADVASQIGQSSFAGWEFSNNSATVTYIGLSTGPRSGAYSLTATGSVAGEFSQIDAGMVPTTTFHSQSSWNIDPLDGQTYSAFDLDPTKGNVYQIEMQYLGYGSLKFSMENPLTGQFIPVHTLQYPNSESAPSLDMPIMKIGGIAENLGNTSDLKVHIGSAALFSETEESPFRSTDAHIVSQSGIGTTFTNIFSIRNSGAFNGSVNLQQIIPLLVNGAVEGTKPAEIQVFLNADIAANDAWKWNDISNSSIEIDESAVAVSIGANTLKIGALALAKIDGGTIDIKSLDVVMQRNDILTVAARATAGTTDATGTITWLED